MGGPHFTTYRTTPHYLYGNYDFTWRTTYTTCNYKAVCKMANKKNGDYLVNDTTRELCFNWRATRKYLFEKVKNLS